MSRCLIVTGGTASKDVFEAVFSEFDFDFIIACDKGLEACHNMSIFPNLIIGDFDSVDRDILDKYKEKAELLRLDTHKDFTDTHVAVEYVVSLDFDEVIIIGATGTRVDHTLSNIGLLKIFADAGIKALIIDENNRIQMIKTSIELLKSEKYKYVSLIPYTEEVTGVSLSGFYYGGENITLKSGESLGVSNQLAAPKGSISLEEGILIVIESHD